MADRKNLKFKRDRLAGRHPLSLLAFFACAVCISMFTNNPCILGIEVALSLVCLGMLKGRKALFNHLKFMILLAILTASINPLFNHRGRTVIARYPSGNALTMEEILYGFMASMILISVLTWFTCFTYCFNEDKLMFIFGWLSPATALTFTMTMRFVPEFMQQAKNLRNISEGIYGKKPKGLIQKIKRGLRIFGALLTWSLEGSVKRAKSMRDRGYGRGRRTAYSIFKWTARDTMFLVLTGATTGVYVYLARLGTFRYWFYPMLYGDLTSGRAYVGYAVVAVLLTLPIIFNYEILGGRRSAVNSIYNDYGKEESHAEN